MEKINIELAGIPLELTLRYKMFRDRYADFQTEKKPCACIEITPEQCACAARGYEPGTLPESVEDLELCAKACAALLPHRRAIIHAVCFVWCGKAWLICAPSGVGKTTHYKQWKRLFPNEVEMLNGDKAVLNFEKQYVTVSASPWAGKENMRQLRTAPLGGIVFLAQDKQNIIKRLSPKEAGVRLFLQFIIPCDNAEQVRFAAQYTERILERTPVWLLRNRGDGASAELCRRTLESELCCADN